MDNSYGLEEIQIKLFEALKEYDRLCRKHHIHYSLHGGTLLGAERNGQFIPWDDDADVSMTRREYIRFKEFTSELPDDYYLDDETTWVPRLIMKDENISVSIDIFIWDYASSNRILQMIRLIALWFCQGMMKKNIDYSEYGLIGKILVFVSSTIGSFFSNEKKLGLYDNLRQRFMVGNKKCTHRANDSFKGIGEVYDVGFMRAYKNIFLEGYAFMVNKRYREALIVSYGEDYMTPPPVSERQPMHKDIRGN